MNYKIIFPLLCLLFSVNVFSQVLYIDRETTGDTLFKKWLKVADVSVSSDKLKKNLLDLDSKIEINRFFRNDYVLIAAAGYDLTSNGGQDLQNDGYVQLRYRDNDKHEYSLESYLQYQWNDALGMEYRNVAGSNLRKRIFDKAHIDLYTALGVFYEGERWNWTAVPNYNPATSPGAKDRNLFRLNHYWKFAHKVNENLDVSAISYFQFPINGNFINLRWYVDINANFKIAKSASFVIHWDHTYDGYRLVPISKFYYSLNFGTQIKW